MDSVQAVSLLVGVVLPVLVGVVTTRATHAGVKAVLLALLSAAAAVGTDMLATPDGFDWQASATNAVAMFVVAVATHFGLYKPTGVSQIVQARVGRTGGS